MEKWDNSRSGFPAIINYLTGLTPITQIIAEGNRRKFGDLQFHNCSFNWRAPSDHAARF